MQTLVVFCLIALSMLAAIAPTASAQHAVERFTLDNGLRVTLWPTPAPPATSGPPLVCVALLFDIGERHDPPGRSGMAHLIEHLLVTAGTAEHPPTTVEELGARYNNQFNAQTGEDYTLVASVARADLLDEELRLYAARLRSLRATTQDLARELPRVDEELRNMRGGIPFLGLLNETKHAVLPLQPGARKGGVIEQLRDIQPDEIHARLADLYTGANARLVVVGAFDAKAVREAVTELFGPVAAGGRIGEPAPRDDATRETVRMRGSRESLAPSVCLAFPMPSPQDPRYPAALVIAARLMERFPPELRDGRWAPPPAQWTPLDQPEVMFLLLPIGTGEEPDAAIARADSIVRAIALRSMTKADATRAKNSYGLMLRMTAHAPALAAMNPYFAAIALGRAEQLGVPSATLGAKVDRVDDDALRACYEGVFAPSARGAGLWTAPPPP